MGSSAAGSVAGAADELVVVLTEIERNVLVREPMDLIATHALGAEPVRSGILEQSSALDLCHARLRMARIGALPRFSSASSSRSGAPSATGGSSRERRPKRLPRNHRPQPSVGASVAATRGSLPV